MKAQNNIENQLQSLKSAYGVPENYFDKMALRAKQLTKNNKSTSRKLYTKLSIAATILLLFGLSITFVVKTNKTQAYQTTDSLSEKSYPKVAKTDLFSDIDDETIEDYILENDLIEDLITEL